MRYCVFKRTTDNGQLTRLLFVLGGLGFNGFLIAFGRIDGRVNVFADKNDLKDPLLYTNACDVECDESMLMICLLVMGLVYFLM